MRIFSRYFILALVISFVALRLITHSTDLQTQSKTANHQYFKAVQGEPPNPDREVLRFERESEVIVYYALWHQGAHYQVQCVLTNKMLLDCEAVIHYGLVRVPASDRYVFNWD